MKTRVRLRLQQADMRSRLRDRPSLKPAAQPKELKKRIVAVVLAYERNYSPVEIARYFGWRPEDVQAWFEAGKPLL
jgi:hypothetical protein